MTKTSTDIVQATRQSAIITLAGRMGVEPDQLFMSSLRSVAFKSPNATNEQLLALCVVANQYSLNPFTKELYAFPDKGGGVVPIVSVDGWSRIMNDHPQFDGMEFVEAEDGAWCECVVYRKDRAHPLRAREFLAECKRNTDPWRSHPRRMLRHKAMIQAARMAFGFAGIYEPDEAERIIETEATVISAAPAKSRTEQVKQMLGVPPADEAMPFDDQTGEMFPISDDRAMPSESA
jgi:phage recombination protein Bet